MARCVDRNCLRAENPSLSSFIPTATVTPQRTALQTIRDQIEKNLHQPQQQDLFQAAQHLSLHQAAGHSPEMIYHLIKNNVPTLLARVGPALRMLAEVHLPGMIAVEFVRGLWVIGQANRDGAALTHERNFVSGFFGVLVTTLANRQLSVAAARNFVLQHTGWINTLREQSMGPLPTINNRTGFRRDLIESIQRFEAGAQTAKLLLDRLSAPREALVQQIHVEFGARGLAAMYEYYLNRKPVGEIL